MPSDLIKADSRETVPPSQNRPLGARQDERLEPDYYKELGGLLPSVAQPPLPLQEFWPGPPPLLHPPWPLHSF